MWKLLNQPLPFTPQLSPTGFGIFLAIASMFPGLSDFVLAISVLIWCCWYGVRLLTSNNMTTQSKPVHLSQLTTSEPWMPANH